MIEGRAQMLERALTTDATAATPPPAAEYPVRLSVDYPEEPRNRLTVLVRPILVIPIVIILSLLSGGLAGDRSVGRGGPGDGYRPPGVMSDRMPGGMFGFGSMMSRPAPAGPSAVAPGAPPAAPAGPGAAMMPRRFGGSLKGFAAGGGILVAPVALMLLFRRKYPRWWFDWNRELSRFGARIGAFLLLLRDEYPSTDEEQAVHLEVDYPDATQLNRWLPLVKWLLALPHYIVLAFLALGVVLVWIVSWFAILITGKQPRGLFDYNVGVARWCARVSGYAFLLVTDKYPPFSMQ